MVSGLPIPPKSQAVVLFTTPHGDSVNRGGCYVYDAYQFISFPMFITMDDYQGDYYYFGQGKPMPSDQKYKKDLEKQASWKVFNSMMKNSTKKGVNSDWSRNIIYREAGIWGRPFGGDDFDRGLKWTDFTFIRRDVWDWMVKKGKSYKDAVKEFSKDLRDQCSCVVEGSDEYNELLERLTKNLQDQGKPVPDTLKRTVGEMIRMRKYGEMSRGDFLAHIMQKVVTSGGAREKWNGEVVYDFKLTPEEQEELIKLTIDMYAFTSVLDMVGRPIIPSFSLAPQSAWYEKNFREGLFAYHAMIGKAMQKDLSKLKKGNYEE
jgi:hypothetical protein